MPPNFARKVSNPGTHLVWMHRALTSLGGAASGGNRRASRPRVTEFARKPGVPNRCGVRNRPASRATTRRASGF